MNNKSNKINIRKKEMIKSILMEIMQSNLKMRSR